MPLFELGDYTLEYSDASDTLTVTQQSTGDAITHDGGTLTATAVSAGTLSLSARQSPPTPTADLLYLDDGTNTSDGQPGLRWYTGSTWVDL